MTLLVSLHVRLCGLSTYIYFSCLFGLWRTSMLSRSSWCLCPFRLSFQRLTFLELTGLSSSIQNPAKWQSSFFIFFYCYPWSTMDRSARHIFVRSDGISAATPELFRRWLVALWCPFHSPHQNLRETLSGPFIVLSFSSHRSHAMVWHVKAAWLTRRHVLWAYCTVRMDG